MTFNLLSFQTNSFLTMDLSVKEIKIANLSDFLCFYSIFFRDLDDNLVGQSPRESFRPSRVGRASIDRCIPADGCKRSRRNSCAATRREESARCNQKFCQLNYAPTFRFTSCLSVADAFIWKLLANSGCFFHFILVLFSRRRTAEISSHFNEYRDSISVPRGAKSWDILHALAPHPYPLILYHPSTLPSTPGIKINYRHYQSLILQLSIIWAINSTLTFHELKPQVQNSFLCLK